MLIKYLFKYISKGTDKIFAKVTRQTSDSQQAAEDTHQRVDEIQNFIDERYICPHEAYWRIFKFNIHNRHTPVQILSVHKENMQPLTFRDSQSLASIVDDEKKKKTTLTEWQRKGEGSIGSLVYVHHASGELFYLRMLLCHQQGCKTFKDIRTVNKVIYDTYRAACEALGILGDDKEWHTALEEAAFSSTHTELHNLFVQILIFCEVASPKRLCDTYWRKMSDDIPKLMSETHRIPNLHINDPELQAKVLYELEVIMKGY
ncbi:hypothetical protein Tco_0081816, partial [Tanacetum coccineum]